MGPEREGTRRASQQVVRGRDTARPNTHTDTPHTHTHTPTPPPTHTHAPRPHTRRHTETPHARTHTETPQHQPADATVHRRTGANCFDAKRKRLKADAGTRRLRVAGESWSVKLPSTRGACRCRGERTGERRDASRDPWTSTGRRGERDPPPWDDRGAVILHMIYIFTDCVL